MSSLLFLFQPLRKRLNKIEKDKISRIGPQKGLKNAKWKENSRGRKIMRFRTEKGKETFQNKVFYFEKEKENGKEENVLGNQGKG